MTWNTFRHKMLYRFAIFASLLLSFYDTNAQNYPSISSEYYSINDGLSDRLITDIEQTRNGFIWLATTNGLNKFDGYDFIVFNNAMDNPNCISDINIDQLEIDKNGNLVIVYHNNLFFFDILNPDTHQTTKVNLLPESGLKGIIRQIMVNTAGDILVLTTNTEGTYVHQFVAPGFFKLLFSLREQRNKQSSSIGLVQLHDGNFILNDEERGLRLIDPKGRVLKQFQPKDFTGITDSLVYPTAAPILFTDTNENVWLSLRQNAGIFRYQPTDRSFQIFEGVPERYNYTRIWEDKKGNILLAQTDGIGMYPDFLGLFTITPTLKVMDLSYLCQVGPRIISLYSEEFTRTILFGIDTGLKIVQSTSPKFKNFLSRDLTEDQRGAIIRGITGRDSMVYFAEESGSWYAINTVQEELSKLELVDSETGNPVEMDCAMDLRLDKKGLLWGISCNNLQEGQLHRYDPTTKKTTTFKVNRPIKAFTQSADGIFWLLTESTSASKGGLISFNPKTELFETFQESEANNSLENAAPYYIMESRDGTLWIGASIGLVKIDRTNATSTVYQTQLENGNNPLRSNIVYVIHEDKEGKLWLGTNNGFSILNPETNDIITYNQNNSLASNTVCGILPDEKNNYWISTFNGLSYFDREANEFHNFFKADGLTHDEFNRFSFYQDAKGRYYFGGVNGLNTFYGSEILKTDTIPSVALTKLVRFNTSIDSIITQYAHLGEIKEIEISPYDSYFQLHFMLPEFGNPKRNQFRTWLQDYEKGWNNLGNTSYIRYNSLPAGTYTLLIEGADPNGNWSDVPLSIRIKVKKIFYKTWWFLIICFLIMGGIAYLIFHSQWQQKLQVERFRTKIASDLHDELSGLLSGIAMQTDMLQMTSEDDNLKFRLKHIGEVSRKAMSKMSDVIWSIDSRKDKVDDLVHRMREHADDILLPLNIKYTLEVKKIERTHKIPPSSRQELYLIFKESINNIVKHSNANRVDILLGNFDGIFQMEIRDNGKGIPKQLNGKNGVHTGQGLSNIKMRARRINAKVEILKDEGYTIRLKMRRLA